ncbi:hypothetical protein ACLOJK_002171 [Asimina triloba]
MENIEVGKGKSSKLGQILKALARSRSISSTKRPPAGLPYASMSKCRSWHPQGTGSADCNGSCTKRQVAPQGCFSVYVGPEKERFIIKMEYINHPLFRMLLEEAEMEYGFSSNGPLVLPCGVDIFHKVLCEMDSEENYPRGCNFGKGYSAYRLLSPSRAGMHFKAG